MNSLAVPASALLAALISGAPAFAQRWQVQYLYDQNKSTLVIADLRFPSAERGIAVGYTDTGSRQDPTSVVTSDGGAHWRVVPLKELPVSLFFLNENVGWMVTAKGIWQTTETGNNWTKVGKTPSPVLRVYFVNEKTGWAVGPRKAVFQTHDGGRHWTKLEAAESTPGDPDYSAYTWIAFANPQLGVIAGYNQPPHHNWFDSERPEWLDPAGALARREPPHLNYTLITRDGGKTWRANSAALFGETTRVRFAPDGTGLGLIEYDQSSPFPTEVYKIDWRAGKSATLFKDKQFSISDMWLDPDGKAYLAGTVSPGKLRDVIPGRVQVLESTDMKEWSEMPVDYRAVADRVTLASAGGELWMASDNGMILKLVK